MKGSIKMATALILGLIVGYVLAFYFPKGEEKIAQSKVALIETPVISQSSFSFINPLAECSNFESQYFDEMIGFKSEVILLIDSIMTNMKGYELAFYFRDLTSGNSVEYNEGIKFTPASLMKVPVLIALLKQAEKNPEILQDMLVFREFKDRKTINKGEFKFKIGASYSLEQLAEIMISYSDNQATLMIIDRIGIEKVKKVERDLRLGTENSFSEEDRLVGVKTYATVFRTLYNASYLNKEMSEKALVILSQSRYGYGIRKAVPLDILMAHKFGIRENNGSKDIAVSIDQLHHFAIVYRPEKPYLIGLMMKGDDEKFMQRMISHIAKHVDDEIVQRTLQIKSANIPNDVR